MKTIVTTTGSFLTGTEIADAVTAYGLALARARRSDVIDIPFITADGSESRVELRIGWLVETVATAVDEPAEELLEIDTIIDLLDRAGVLAHPIAPNGPGYAVSSDRSSAPHGGPALYPTPRTVSTTCGFSGSFSTLARSRWTCTFTNRVSAGCR